MMKNFGGLMVNYGKIAANRQIKTFSNSYHTIQEKMLLCTKTTEHRTNHNFIRLYSDGMKDSSSSPRVVLPPLTNDAMYMVPNVFKNIKNLYYIHCVLRTRVDPEFSISEFMDGASHALVFVSHALEHEDYDSLIGLVDNEVIDRLKNTISTLSNEQKKFIHVDPNEILLGFPYEVRLFDEGVDENVRTFAEILTVFYVLKGKRTKKPRDQNVVIDLLDMSDIDDRFITCNYKFRRDYTDGNTAPWEITWCNHFMPYES